MDIIDIHWGITGFKDILSLSLVTFTLMPPSELRHQLSNTEQKQHKMSIYMGNETQSNPGHR